MRDSSTDLLYISSEVGKVKNASGNQPPNTITLTDGQTVVTTDAGQLLTTG